MRDIEKRNSFINTEFRAEQVDGKIYLDGYFIRFNEPTELWPGVFEVVTPESVKGSLDNDIRCLFNHDTGIVLGRTGNNTLEIRVDDKGLYGSVEINNDDSQAMAIYHRVKRGDINACSFGFYVNKETVEERDDGTTYITLNDIDIHEVSVVTFPAYPTTEIKARKRDIEAMKTEKLEDKKRKVREKLNGIKTINFSKKD